ncbi:MAG: hypothetical protein N4A49_14690 [Marinifilaceae bacterium]|jgi:hypothetical protein|nr:hypothetical protein [Marinifilaceae bacterium]
MKLFKNILIIILFFLCSHSVFSQEKTNIADKKNTARRSNSKIENDFNNQAQSLSLYQAYEYCRSYEHLTQQQWDSTWSASASAKSEIDLYNQLVSGSEYKYLMYPFWMGSIHKDVNYDKVDRLGYFVYPVDITNSIPKSIHLLADSCIIDDDKLASKPMDLVVFCSGLNETKQFLLTDSLQNRCFEYLYYCMNRESFNKESNFRNPDGINIYMPYINSTLVPYLGRFIRRLQNSKYISNIESKRDIDIIVTLPSFLPPIPKQTQDVLDEIDGVYFCDFNQYGVSSKIKQYSPDTAFVSRDLVETYDMYKPYHYRPEPIWKIIRKNHEDIYKEKENYIKRFYEKTHDIIVYPYWLGDLYNFVFSKKVKNVNTLAYLGYVIDPISGGPSLVNSLENETVIDKDFFSETSIDLMVLCRGISSTEFFLSNRDARITCLKNVLNRASRGYGIADTTKHLRKPDGINFYFPDYNATNKNNFVKFFKELYLLNKTPRTKDSIAPNYKISVSLSPSQKENTTFYSAILQYVDCVYFNSYDQYGIPSEDSWVFSYYNDKTGLISQIKNKFYGSDFNFSDLNGMSNDLTELIVSDDFSFENWEIFYLVIIVMVIMLLAAVALFFLCCRFQDWVISNPILVVVICVCILIEMGLLWIFMVDSMGVYPVFFSDMSLTNLSVLSIPPIIAGFFAKFKGNIFKTEIDQFKSLGDFNSNPDSKEE